jgi:hypothetical protein
VNNSALEYKGKTMDFSLTDEHRTAQKMVRDFTHKEVIPIIYEGINEIHQLQQANYALGYRKDRPLRCELPAYDADYWQNNQ